MTRMPLPILGMLLLGIAACKSSTATHLSQSFRNPGFEETVFKELFVIGVAQDQEGRKAFEDAFVAAIVNEGGGAQASWKSLPESSLLSEERIHSAIESSSFDGVLVTRLLSVDTKNTKYTPPRKYNRGRKALGFVPAGPAWGMGWGGFYSFYAISFTEVHRPGYFDTSRTFRLETNLYSAATMDLVWMAQSETVDPKSVPDLLVSMTAAVAKRLDQERLIP
ncbi:MAG: hypothetical protein WCF10_06470 [Polyangiales bacterium]